MSESVNEVKEKMRQRFVKVALDPQAQQRHPHGPASAKKLGYDPDEIDGLPAVVVESFAGVGNPLGLHPVRPGEKVGDGKAYFVTVDTPPINPANNVWLEPAPKKSDKK